ncbi:alpha-1,3-mannosyltransferase ALG2 [Capsaspora owczarzaki ATCC 30864]|uniref:Alpha-1,3/1,6-mannosyltransferase ALG2 n=1 Tax=Capsaspora owczarzaki (strain ATCC 30864) TaxID=595528 RepID=A0A0D2X4T2_CAPO3|nr:alpha-1,3-mannosyltransferase ALG2 [Capsaspora owczarzaki ATCC 30864]KJE96604.1 alpha-1,3-mannosyltransferase ALG2 [Capsaspora owczarzaki ATCC 30864]|eukprot:XP_004344525.1 alpha-1,3-mannosyltransferase ALG2 [Capsaspora owczarzaki ATCC 30864]
MSRIAFTPTRIAFVHPDLGIGGAERLVVDAALACTSKGHEVHLFTSHHDPARCFSETRDGQLPVHVHGSWFPRNIAGRFYAFCAYLRMIITAIAMALFYPRFDVVVVDQISACIPFLRIFSPKSKIVFYCHFPDQLLTQRTSLLKRLYRSPIDWLEERTTGLADTVLVNSKFTAGVFNATFRSLQHIRPQVVYPAINVAAFGSADDNGGGRPRGFARLALAPNTTFLSINRFERKKNLMLALEALLGLKQQLTKAEWEHVRLVLAGGYDERLPENREYHAELQQFAQANGLADHVSFKRSFSDEEKIQLLRSCDCLMYTPTNEHFGIGPLEGMISSRPVIAVNTGGPLETVVHKRTGFLCNPTSEAFTAAMLEIVRNPDAAEQMGVAGRARVLDKFSFAAFADQLEEVVQNLIEAGPSPAAATADRRRQPSRKAKKL